MLSLHSSGLIDPLVVASATNPLQSEISNLKPVLAQPLANGANSPKLVAYCF